MTRAIDTVFLHVTRACNLRCGYCYFSAAARAPGEMTRAEYAPVWRDIVDLAAAKAVFTGGEPFMRADLLDLVRDLAEADVAHVVKRCVNTNGAGMTRDRARRMIGLVDEVRISLDGFRGIHDRHRGEGSFDAAVSALDLLQREGFEPKVLITVTTESLPGLEPFLRWLAARKLTRIRLNPVRLIGRASARPELAVRVGDLAAVIDAVRGAASGGDPARAGRGLPRSCGAGHFVNVMPEGDVFPCHVLTGPAFLVGNLRVQPLAALAGRGTVLEQLRNVDLRTLALASPKAGEALEKMACLGVVRDAPVLRQWVRLTPVAQ